MKKLRISALILLCILALIYSILLQHFGYLTYLNSDMSSELALAKRQVETHSLIQMDWIYSTEIHSIHMNLFYAIAFLFTSNFEIVRIIGNTIGFLIAMLSLWFLGTSVGLSNAVSLLLCAMLPLSPGTLYAQNVTIGGYYIIHFPFAYFMTALWIHNSSSRKFTDYLFFVLCFLMGLLSVRYVLCFVIPMFFCAFLTYLQNESHSLIPDKNQSRTLIAFIFCICGYVVSEIVNPHLFLSGMGNADSFVFNPQDPSGTFQIMLTVLSDFLKLMGWRPETSFFSIAGLLNIAILGVLFIGIIIKIRAYRHPEWFTESELSILVLSDVAFFINLVCFLCIKGTYLNRYLIIALFYLLPALGILLKHEPYFRLKFFMVLLMTITTVGSSLLFFKTTYDQSQAYDPSEDALMETANVLLDNGYSFGYGTFWNTGIMQERTNGALSFSAVRPFDTETGAPCNRSLEPIRWLEPTDASSLDAAPGKTFLMLTQEEASELDEFLSFSGAPLLFANEQYQVYTFESSQSFWNTVYWSTMKLENASFRNGTFFMAPNGRMRVPTSWREAGDYMLTFTINQMTGTGGKARIYSTSNFTLIAETDITEEQNTLPFSLPYNDKYWMILFTTDSDTSLHFSNLSISKNR